MHAEIRRIAQGLVEPMEACGPQYQLHADAENIPEQGASVNGRRWWIAAARQTGLVSDRRSLAVDKPAGAEGCEDGFRGAELRLVDRRGTLAPPAGPTENERRSDRRCRCCCHCHRFDRLHRRSSALRIRAWR